MSLLQNSNAIPQLGGYNLTDSVRFRSSSDAYLSWTPSSAGNRKTWTWSAWVKRGALDSNFQGLFSADTSSNRIYLLFDTDNSLRLDGNAVIIFDTSAVYRDCSAWYHIVLAVDTTQATASNRFKLYVNGTQITSFATDGRSSIAQNTDLLVNNTTIHNIGRDTNTTTRRFDGYMTEINFVDGQALTASDFGETDATTGVWKPKKYTGSYGTNGFYLPMKQTTQASGFNTVLYQGNGGTQSITGVGFQPDLTWIKHRSGAQGHSLYDSIRGYNYKVLESSSTGAETTETGGVSGVLSDGFSLNGNNTIRGGTNGSGQTYVAWCWEGGTPDTYSAIFNGSRRLEITSGISGNFTPTSGFTFECWIKPYNTTLSQVFYVGGGANSWSTTNGYVFGYINGSTGTAQWQWNNSGATHTLVLSTAPTVGEWNHLVVGYDGTTTRIWLNGASQGTSTNGYTVPTTVDQVALGGRFSDFTNAFNGEISNLRFVKGTDVYGVGNSSITVPTTNLTAITNTELLTFQDSTIQDNSTNGFTFTDYGNVITNQAFPYINNTDGSISSTVSANTAKGFSVVTYTGTGADGTVGHGLGVVPDMVIVKNRDVTSDWRVWHTGLSGSNYYVSLNLTDAEATSTGLFGTHTSSVISLKNGFTTNGSGNAMVAYCFSEVSGFSKFGSYTGNGTSQSINLGFRPAFVMWKRIDAAGNSWIIKDNTRYADNQGNLFPNATTAENTDTSVTFTDTGFDVDSSLGYNGSGRVFIYMAFADTRDYQWNFDASGNKNNWTPNNINSNASSETTYDIMSDVPTLTNEDTGNWATLNPLAGTKNTISDGNLKYSGSTGGDYHRPATLAASSGKWYFEVKATAIPGDYYVGISEISNNGNYDSVSVGNASNGSQYAIYSSSGGSVCSKVNNGFTATSLSKAVNGDIIQVAFDLDNNKIWFGINNTWADSGNPSTGANSLFTVTAGTYAPALTLSGAGVSTTLEANFGQRPFAYTPPTGFKKLNTYNLPDSAIKDGSNYFNTVTYTGNSSTNAITGVGFSPDLVWIKNRTNANNHLLVDSVRGVDKTLESNTTNAETTSTTNVSSFDADGFTLGSGANASNNSSYNYVAWNWRGSDSTAVSNTSGTITSTVSANTTSGFSVVTYTGTGVAGTIGHGLGSAPEMIILKGRDANTGYDDWYVYHSSLGNGAKIFLNLTDASSASSAWNSTSPTNNVFSVRANTINTSGIKMVAYCFAEVEGFSKFGTYTGNNSTDGPFIYTGFSPAFVIIKASTGAYDWLMIDSARASYNSRGETLFPNSSAAEVVASPKPVDFYSNGFQLRAGGGANASNGSSFSYIYMAFAENPFKHSLGR